MMVMLMLKLLLKQAEKQKLDAINQCQKTAAERDEAIQGNRFLQSKLKEAEIALKELGQNVTDDCSRNTFGFYLTFLHRRTSVNN